MRNPSIQTQVKCPVCDGKTSYGTLTTGVRISCHKFCWNSKIYPTIADALYFGRIEAADYIAAHGGTPGTSHLTPGRIFSADDLSEHFGQNLQKQLA